MCGLKSQRIWCVLLLCIKISVSASTKLRCLLTVELLFKNALVFNKKLLREIINLALYLGNVWYCSTFLAVN